MFPVVLTHTPETIAVPPPPPPPLPSSPYPDRLTPVGKVQFDKVHFVKLLCDELHFGKSPFATLHNAPDRCRWPGWGNCSRG